MNIWIIFIVIFLLASLTLNLLLILKKNSDKRKHLLEQELILSSLYSFVPQSEIIFSFFVALESVNDVENDADLRASIQEMSEVISRIRSSQFSIREFREELKKDSLLDFHMYYKMKEQLQQVNHDLYSSSLNIISTIQKFFAAYIKNKEMLNESTYTMAKLIFYLASIVPILSDFSGSSNEISKQIIMEMVKKFEIITQFSEKITGDIRKTMSDLMDESRSDSLAAVVNKARAVVTDFENFFADIQRLKEVSNNFVEKSVDKLTSISAIADSIEEIAETIKVISLNVSVEAANTGEAGKGFQVLARDLRQFAYSTLKFAQDVKKQVKDTIVTTEGLKEDYLTNMNRVYEYVIGIKQSLEDFSQIIHLSFSKIKQVIDTLEEFSHKLDAGIKDVVGQLQYYDVRAQEVEHISVFISEILERFYSDVDQSKLSSILPPEEQNAIRMEMLKNISRLVSTSNERAILRNYEIKYGIRSKDETEKEDDASEKLTKEAGEVVLF